VPQAAAFHPIESLKHAVKSAEVEFRKFQSPLFEEHFGLLFGRTSMMPFQMFVVTWYYVWRLNHDIRFLQGLAWPGLRKALIVSFLTSQEKAEEAKEETKERAKEATERFKQTAHSTAETAEEAAQDAKDRAKQASPCLPFTHHYASRFNPCSLLSPWLSWSI